MVIIRRIASESFIVGHVLKEFFPALLEFVGFKNWYDLLNSGFELGVILLLQVKPARLEASDAVNLCLCLVKIAQSVLNCVSFHVNNLIYRLAFYSDIRCVSSFTEPRGSFLPSVFACMGL